MPEWFFELAGLPSPGVSTLRSFTVKALERVADGVVVPQACDQPLTVVEFQFQKDETIYQRMVVEMAAVQEANPGRSVQGVIFFGYNNSGPADRAVDSGGAFLRARGGSRGMGA